MVAFDLELVGFHRRAVAKFESQESRLNITKSKQVLRSWLQCEGVSSHRIILAILEWLKPLEVIITLIAWVDLRNLVLVSAFAVCLLTPQSPILPVYLIEARVDRISIQTYVLSPVTECVLVLHSLRLSSTTYRLRPTSKERTNGFRPLTLLTCFQLFGLLR